jgi:hypothetical protein
VPPTLRIAKVNSLTSRLVFVANEPRAYRETIALALSALRPHAEVVTVEPDRLDAEIRRRRPDVALCSRLSPAVESSVPTWVLLYPDGANIAIVSVDGRRSMTGGLALDDLAAVIGPT